MAITQNPLIGASKGSLGNVTMTRLRGKNILKNKAINNYSDPTPTQLRNNFAFALLVAFSRTIKSLYRAGFKEVATSMSEYNKFMQLNNPEALTGSTVVDTAIDPAKIVIAQGTGSAPLSLIESEVAGGIVTIQAQYSGEDKPSTGSLMKLLVLDDGDASVLHIGEAVVELGAGDEVSAEFNTPVEVVAGNRAIWFIVDSFSKKVSDSVNVELTA